MPKSEPNRARAERTHGSTKRRSASHSQSLGSAAQAAVPVLQAEPCDDRSAFFERATEAAGRIGAAVIDLHNATRATDPTHGFSTLSKDRPTRMAARREVKARIRHLRSVLETNRPAILDAELLLVALGTDQGFTIGKITAASPQTAVLLLAERELSDARVAFAFRVNAASRYRSLTNLAGLSRESWLRFEGACARQTVRLRELEAKQAGVGEFRPIDVVHELEDRLPAPPPGRSRAKRRQALKMRVSRAFPGRKLLPRREAEAWIANAVKRERSVRDGLASAAQRDSEGRAMRD